MARSRIPEALLPLTPPVFHILLALSDGERHGYAIMRQVAADTGRPGMPLIRASAISDPGTGAPDPTTAALV